MSGWQTLEGTVTCLLFSASRRGEEKCRLQHRAGPEGQVTTLGVGLTESCT